MVQVDPPRHAFWTPDDDVIPAAEVYGLAELWSEDFEHDRRYGTVRVLNSLL